MSTSVEEQLREYAVHLDDAIDRRVAARSTTVIDAVVEHPASRTRDRRPMVLAVGLVAAVATVVLVVQSHRADAPPIQVVDVPQSDAAPGTDAPATIASAPSTPAAATTLERPLEVGDSGTAVRQLQERLAELHFDPGTIDGVFGTETSHAVWAFKALVLKVPIDELAKDAAPAEVTDELWQTMQQPLALVPRRVDGTGTHVEILLPEQVLVVVADGQVALVAHISSGTGQTSCQTVTYDTDENGSALPSPVTKAVCGVAKTPPGAFTITRSANGDRVSTLGGLYNPIFFDYGIAISGNANVPLRPSSRGEVRVDTSIADRLPDLVHIGDRVLVWGDDGRQPEDHTPAEMLPSFDYPDPSAGTTTSSAAPVDTSSPANVQVPLLTGLLEEQGRAQLVELGLTATVTFQDFPSDSVNVGRIIDQAIAVGNTVAPYSAVPIVVGRALSPTATS
ncbi:MAG: hypothetical protein JWM34_761 [Ilumatobacteraceae bacterium]|nr:hypothetical protein [Ilumatobacteraceae bacterium]